MKIDRNDESVDDVVDGWWMDELGKCIEAKKVGISSL